MSTASLDRAGVEQTLAALPEPKTSRFRLTGLVFVHLALGLPLLFVTLLVTAAIPLSLIVIGIPVLVLLVPVLATLAGAHRYIAGQVLRTRVARPYAPTTTKVPHKLVMQWARDPARWRDLAWGYAGLLIGTLLELLILVLFAGILWWLAFPIVWSASPKGVFDFDYGFYRVDTLQGAFTQWALAVVTALVWWWLTPVLARARARLDLSLLQPTRAELEKRLAEVSQSRAETLDHSAAELRRIERDLHDGAQARIVSLGMTLGLAQQALPGDPARAAQLLAEARATTTSALGDLRSVVRGIHPPVLADRGLAGAVQALALDMPIPVPVRAELPGRPPAPVESAAYFAIMECLANVAKHAGASRGSVDLGHDGERLHVVVADNGRGGADPARGTGLDGVAHRLGAFDGTIVVNSPAGGPTVVTMELPCALSSPKTTPSSGTA